MEQLIQSDDRHRHPELDSLTAIVWDYGLPTRVPLWHGQNRGTTAPARFVEMQAQHLRQRREYGDQRLSLCAAELQHGSVLLDFELIPSQHRIAIGVQYARLMRQGRLGHGDAQSKTRFVRYNEPLARSAQVAFCPFVSRLAGQRLMPTFTYTAHYASDGNLPFHQDRDQCEVTLALCIDRRETAMGRSLLCVVSGSITRAAELRPGWGLIFRGRDLPHGRITIGTEADQPTVMLLHYVDESFAGEIL